jgi:hypothetical protein
MKRAFIFLFVMLLFCSPAFALLNELKTISVEEIKKLSDEDLIKYYVDAKIETNASKVFHSNAGFNNLKEYDQFKALLAYIVRLRQEIELRKLEAPPVDEWLK